MGRKKRPAAAMAQHQHQHQHQPAPNPYQQQQHQQQQQQQPPPYATHPPRPYQQSLPPPPYQQLHHHHQQQQPPLPPTQPPLPPALLTPSAETSKNKKIESFTVKKYRPSKSFRCIEAFQRYTKTHRMTDATFTQISPPNRGATSSSPMVFTARIGKSDLSWGRGKTRDVAIDNACRAAFALVAAHGYTDFDCNDDCLTVEPMQLHVKDNGSGNAGNGNGNGNGNAAPLPPPPMNGMLPPPPPMGMGIGMGMGMGMGMNVPPPPLPPVPPPMMNSGVMLIPQAKTLSHQVAVPTVIKKDVNMAMNNIGMGMSMGTGINIGASGNGNGSTVGTASSSLTQRIGAGSISLTLDKKRHVNGVGGSNGSSGKEFKTFQKSIKGGLSLMYDDEADGDGVVTMEMRRAKLEKYREVLEQCWDKRRALVTGTGIGIGPVTGTPSGSGIVTGSATIDM